MTGSGRWRVATALAVFIVVAQAIIGGAAWGAGLASTEWPMFHRDAAHTGAAQMPGPPWPQVRWWQGGAQILPFEADYISHGPQGPIWSSAATSEINPSLAGAKKVWYFQSNFWAHPDFAIAAPPLGATRDAVGVVTITTNANHPFIVGDRVLVQGVVSSGGSDFNGLHDVLPVPTPTTFQYLQAGLLPDQGGGGAAQLAQPQLRSEFPDDLSTEILVTDAWERIFETSAAMPFVGAGGNTLLSLIYRNLDPLSNELFSDVNTIAAAPAGAARVANGVTINTVSGVQVQVGDRVTVTGVTSVGGTNFNGTFTVAGVGASSFTYLQAGADDTGGGGTARVASAGLARRIRIPAGTWTFDIWVQDVSAATVMDLTVYAFPNGDNSDVTRAPLPGLSPVSIPIPATVPGEVRHIVFAVTTTQEVLLAPGDGIALGAQTTGGTVGLLTEGRTRTRVETPIEVPAIYAGADDGGVYAFDAATGNVLWSFNAEHRASIFSAVRVGGRVTVATNEAHGFDVGDEVIISGVTSVGGTDFNGRFVITEVRTAMEFSYAQNDVDDPNGTGGSAVRRARFRSSPAVGDDGSIYIGSTEGSSHGRLYSLNPDGTLKWSYPSAEQTFYFRSDQPVGFPADTAALSLGPGDGTDSTATIAQTGALPNGQFVRFRPLLTNNVVEPSLPGDLSNAYGWLAEINPTAVERTVSTGAWRLDLALRAPAPANTAIAQGHINYRISKVTIGPLALRQELLGWTEDPELLSLPTDGSTIRAHITTPRIEEISFVVGEYVLVELAISQTASAGAGGGWQLLLNGQLSAGGADSQLITPPMSQAPLDAITSSPVISADDVVYVATQGGEMHAVEASGHARWFTTLREGGVPTELTSSPALSAGGTLYIGSMGGRLFALDADDGQIVWRYPEEGAAPVGPIESSPALDEERAQIYFGCDEEPYDDINGNRVYDLGERFTDLNGSGVRDPGTLFCIRPVLQGGVLRPALQWSAAAGGSIIATPAIGPNGKVYVGALDRYFYSFNPDGTRPAGGWPFFANGEIRSSAAISVARAQFHFLNEGVVEEPNPNRLHLSAALPAGARQPAEIGLTFTNPNAVRRSLGPSAFVQQFRTRPRSVELGMPTILTRGSYWMRFWARAAVDSGQGEEGRIFFKVFHATPGNLSAKLLMTFPKQTVVAGASPAQYLVQAQLASDEFMGPNDYLRVEVWAEATIRASGSGTVYFDFDGNLASAFETPVQVEDTALVYFATSVLRDVQTSATIPKGRVYCLNQNAGVVWPGFDPRAGDPTAFTASPALWEAETVYDVTQSGAIVEGLRRREPVLYLGGQDSVMWALGPVSRLGVPPPVIPPQLLPPGELTLTKQANTGTVAEGDIITYTLRYRNSSSVLSNPARNVTIRDPLPSDVVFLDASDGGDGSSGTVIWQAPATPDLAVVWPGQSSQVSFRVQVTDPFPGVVDPLGWGDAPRQPLVSLSTTDPMVDYTTSAGDKITPPNDLRDFVWGQPLYLRVIGTGKAGEVVNSRAGAQVTISATTGERGAAAPLTTYVGWGKRFKLSFIYDDAQPANQPISFTIDIIPAVSATRTGRAEEGVSVTLPAGNYQDEYLNSYYLEYPDPNQGEPLNVMVFKVQLNAQGYTSASRDVSVTDLPSRAWTPYFWRIEARQSRGGTGAQEQWGPTAPLAGWKPYTDPLTGLRRSERPETYDFVIHNPLQVADALDSDASYALAGGLRVNPGTQTRAMPFIVTNTAKQSLVGRGREPQPNVVRWEKVDLAQQGGLYPSYNPRDENYLAENRLHVAPDRLALRPGESGAVYVWGDIPSYLYPGTGASPVYQAPSLNPSTPAYDMPIFVDLNGNLAWDAGEAKFEDAAGGTYAPFIVGAGITVQPWLEFSAQTVDHGKLATGVSSAARTPGLLNLGNTDLSPITLDSKFVDPDTGAPSPLLPVQRSDLPGLGLSDWRALRPAWMDTSVVTGAAAKTPVGWPRPNQTWVALYEPYTDQNANGQYDAGEPYTDVNSNGRWDPTLPWSQPAGAYSGLPDAVSTAMSVTDRAQSRLKLRVVERRLSGFVESGADVNAAIPGADIDPCAAWLGNDTLRLFWSSNSRADRASPGANDPYLLRYRTLTRTPGKPDTDTFVEAAQSYPGGAITDPMDSPAAPVAKWHVTPGFAPDNGDDSDPNVHTDDNGWLFWGGSALRANGTGGHYYDNRLLWTSAAPPTWQPGAAIEDEPDVAGGGQATTDLFRLQPRPLFWIANVSGQDYEFNYVVLDEHSASQAWGLALRYRSRTWPGGAWSSWGTAIVESADATSGLSAVRDPSAFLYQNMLWVAFSAVSSYHRNYDIYIARYDPAPVAGRLNKWPFAAVAGELLEPNPSLKQFSSRDKQWSLSPAPEIYVENAAGVMTAIGGTVGGSADSQGWYTITGASYDRYDPVTRNHVNVPSADVKFHPGLGVVDFSPNAVSAAACNYTPSLLRLTASPGDESNPAAFIETYRYLDGSGNQAPAGYAPRLWAFWVQEGTASAGAEIMYATLREVAANRWSPERGARSVPVDHAANDFGLCAVKDPRYAQVWLFWSSTRGAPRAPAGGDAGGAAVNTDIYYQVFDPELP